MPDESPSSERHESPVDPAAEHGDATGAAESKTAPAELGPGDFVSFDPRALTLRQIRDLAPTRTTFFSAILIKLIRLRVVSNYALRNPPVLDELPRELLPSWTAAEFERESKRWEALGFRRGPTLSLRAIGAFAVCQQTLAGPDERLSAVLVALETGRAPKGERRLSAACWVTDSEACRYGASSARILLGGTELDHFDHLPGPTAEALVQHVRDHCLERSDLVPVPVQELGDRVREFETRETLALIEKGTYKPLREQDRALLEKTGITLHESAGQSICRRCGGFEPSFRRPGNDGVCDACVEKHEDARTEAVRKVGTRSGAGLLGCVALVGFVVFESIALTRPAGPGGFGLTRLLTAAFVALALLLLILTLFAIVKSLAEKALRLFAGADSADGGDSAKPDRERPGP